MSAKSRVASWIASARRRWPALDHAVRTQEHYGRVKAGSQAGAVTYFAFLSFFPILALAFFVVGYVARYDPRAQDNLVNAIEQVLPGMIGNQQGQISLQSIQDAAGAVGIVGAVTLLYSGLGWLSGMRTALQVVFELPPDRQPSFLVGKLRDLVALAAVGLTLLLSVVLSGVITQFSTEVLDLLGLDHDLSWLVQVSAILVALVANTCFFYLLFTLLAQPRPPRRALWHGALLGSLAFEVLKQLSSNLLAATHRSPAFQAFGIALILLVWINYFSRIVMYAAAWAVTSPGDRDVREPETHPVPVAGGGGVPSTASVGRSRSSRVDPRLAFGAGAAVALGLVAAVRRHRG
jgi:membrane protein